MVSTQLPRCIIQDYGICCRACMVLSVLKQALMAHVSYHISVTQHSFRVLTVGSFCCYKYLLTGLWVIWACDCNYQSERRYQSQPGSWPCRWDLGPGSNGGRWAARSLTAGWTCTEPGHKYKLEWNGRRMEDLIGIYRDKKCGLTVVPSKRSRMKVMALLLMPMKRLIHDKET